MHKYNTEGDKTMGEVKDSEDDVLILAKEFKKINEENQRFKKENIFLRKQLSEINKYCKDILKCIS